MLLDDPEGMAAGLIERAGGRPRDALLATEAALARAAEGLGRLRPALPRRSRWRSVFATAEQIAEKAGDSYVTVERLLLALAMEKEAATAKILAEAGVTPTDAQPGDQRDPQGPHRRHRLGREPATTR